MQIKGTVVHGKEMSRTLGYPTANLAYISPETLKKGMWACVVRLENDERVFRGVAVVGKWDQADGYPGIEVHLLDFSDDLYGKTLLVEPRVFLRDLFAFSQMQELVKQIQIDVQQTREKIALHE